MGKNNTPVSSPERFHPRADQGLSAKQVAQRIAEHQMNFNKLVPSKSIGLIIRDNVCTLFNLVVTILGAAVLLVGSYQNLLFLGIMVCNLVIGIIQEIRTKWIIDKLSILSAVQAHVVRDGRRQAIDLTEVVLDDVLELTRGNQVVADCVILEGECAVNESLITGESDAIPKQAGDKLLSGSFLVTGSCLARADRVGEATYVSAITNEARKHKRVRSEIMLSLRKITKFVSLAIFPIGTVLFLNQLSLEGNTFQNAVVSTTAALIGMIPEGLVLLTSVVLAVGVTRLSKYRVLVQELYCIEALARVDVLCLDKTGTLTEGKMVLQQVLAVPPATQEEAESALRLLCRLTKDDDTPTFQAIFSQYGEPSDALPASCHVPFSSERKWSGVSSLQYGTFLLGAPERLWTSVALPWNPIWNDMATEGRLLLLAHTAEPLEGEQLPSVLQPLAFLIIQDSIRPEASETLRFFAEQGVTVKVISGDNPLTAATIARKAGVPNADCFVDASSLQTEEELFEAVRQYTVFGRVSPLQKKQMVLALKQQQHTVAMTGDGVNDVLALKEADCSIAMASGSEAARNVSHLVLLDSNFAAMPYVVYEGRRSINNLQRSASLFLVKTMFSICLSLIFLFLPNPYPFHPIQLTMISALTIGFPSFVLAMEPNRNRIQGHFMKNIFGRAIPGAAAIVIASTAAAVLSPLFQWSWEEVSTLCVSLTAFTGLLTLFKLSVPFTVLRRLLFCSVCIGLAMGIFLFPSVFSLLRPSPELLLTSCLFCASCFLLFALVNRLVPICRSDSLLSQKSNKL